MHPIFYTPSITDNFYSNLYTMATIKKIVIKGFFGKGDFEWNLNPVVNILGGKNGSGKSTIFKSCYAMLNDKNMFAAMEKNLEKVFQEIIITFSNNWTLFWPYASGTLVLDSNNPYMDSIGVKDENGQIRNIEDLRVQTQLYLINSFEQHLNQAIQYWQRPKSIPLNNPTMLDLMIMDQINLRNRDFGEIMENFIDSSSESDEERQYKNIYKMVYSELNHFLSGYDQKISNSFDFTKDGAKIGYEQLSMGEKQLLLLLLMVGNTKQAPCIFFMDEPDLSMHIDWKEELVTRLHNMNKNMQIILSTHAPSVITGWMDCVNEVSQLIKN